MINRRFGRFAALAVAVLAPSAVSAEVPFTPAKGGYTIVFPDKPQEKEVSLSPDVKETVYSVNRGDAAFLAGFTEYTQDMDIEKELVGDVQSFVTSLPAQLTERKRTMVKLANGAMVQQVEFTLRGREDGRARRGGHDDPAFVDHDRGAGDEAFRQARRCGRVREVVQARGAVGIGRWKL